MRQFVKSKASKIKELKKPYWERQPSEPLMSFEYFLYYKDIPFNIRSLQKVADNFEIELRGIAEKSRRWRWQDRMAAWVDYIDKKKQQIALDEINEMNKRVAKHAKTVEAALMTAVTKYLSSFNKKKISYKELAGDPNKFMRLIISIAEKLGSITDVERKAMGQPTEISKLETTEKSMNINFNYDELSQEELIEKAKEAGFEPIRNNQDS